MPRVGNFLKVFGVFPSLKSPKSTLETNFQVVAALGFTPQSKLTPTIQANIYLFVVEEDPKEKIGQRIRRLRGESALDPGRLASRASHLAVMVNAQILCSENLRGALLVRGEDVQPDLECGQALSRVKIRHVFFRQETRNPIGIELGLGNIGVDGSIEILEDDYLIALLFTSR